jgi:hypothetical protein
MELYRFAGGTTPERIPVNKELGRALSWNDLLFKEVKPLLVPALPWEVRHHL